jgi:hypothetical protein
MKINTIISLILLVLVVFFFINAIILSRSNDNNMPILIQSHLLPTIDVPVGSLTISPTPIAGQSATITPQINTAAWVNR